MNAEKNKIAALAASFAAVGLVAGIIRFFQLEKGFEPLTGLPVAGSPYGRVLAVLAAAAALFAGVLSLYLRRRPVNCEPGAVGGAPLALFAVGTFFGCAAGAVETALAVNARNYFEAFMGVFLMLSAALLIPTVRRVARRGAASGMVLAPVVWACLRLITVYRDLSRAPTESDYAYTLFGIMTLIILLFSMASYIYRSKGALSRMLVAALLTLFFAGLSCVGGIIFWINNYGLIGGLRSAAALRDSVLPAFIMLYALLAAAGLLTLLLRPRRMTVNEILGE